MTIAGVLLTAGLFIYIAGAAIAGFIEPTNLAAYAGYEYVLAAAAGALLVFLLGSHRSFLARLSRPAFLAGTMLAFLVTRLWWVYAVPTEPTNDFLVLHNLAGTLSAGQPIGGIGGGGNWPIFMYTWGYSLLLGGLYAIFGKAVLVAKLFNVAMGACALWAVYAWARNIAPDKNEKIARAVAVLFLLWPTQLVMTNVIAAEHVSLASAAVAFWLLSVALQPTSSATGTSARTLARCVAIGGLLAVAYLTRFPLLVALVACLMTLAIARGLTRRLLLEAGAVLAGFVLLNVAYTGLLATVYQVRLPGRSVAPNLLVGVNTASGGAWNAEDHGKLLAFRTFEDASAWAWDESLRRIRAAPGAVLALMPKKAATYWRTDEYGVWWGVETAIPPEKTAGYLRRLYHVTAFYHTGALVLGAWGALWLAFRRARHPGLNLVALPLLGSTALHSLLEVQSRYHYPFEPMLFVLAAFGIASLVSRPLPNSTSPDPAPAPPR